MWSRRCKYLLATIESGKLIHLLLAQSWGSSCRGAVHISQVCGLPLKKVNQSSFSIQDDAIPVDSNWLGVSPQLFFFLVLILIIEICSEFHVYIRCFNEGDDKSFATATSLSIIFMIMKFKVKILQDIWNDMSSLVLLIHFGAYDCNA